MRKNIKIIEYDCVGSTNVEARKYVTEALNFKGVLLIAKEQSAGRGRLGRTFVSRSDRGIYMSLLYLTSEPLCDAVSITTAAAVFVAEAIEKAVGEKMQIKWVNDIYNDRGKVAGILTETFTVGSKNAIIVGIGINTGESDFPDELKGIASSIGEIDEEQRQSIIANIADRLLSHAQNLQDTSHITEYRKRFMLTGAQVELWSAGDKIGEGEILGVSDGGGLFFLKNGEKEPRIVNSGEVSVRNIKK